MTTIKNWVDDYGVKKAEFDVLKKETEELNKKIKDYMQDNGLDTYDTSKYSVSHIIQHRESMNEEKLLSIAHKNNLPIIRTVEVIDMDALESALYHGDIPQDVVKEISKCKEVKEVHTIKVKEKK